MSVDWHQKTINGDARLSLRSLQRLFGSSCTTCVILYTRTSHDTVLLRLGFCMSKKVWIQLWNAPLACNVITTRTSVVRTTSRSHPQIGLLRNLVRREVLYVFFTYQLCRTNQFSKMTAFGLWLVELFFIFPLKPVNRTWRNLTVLYQVCAFYAHRTTKITALASYCLIHFGLFLCN